MSVFSSTPGTPESRLSEISAWLKALPTPVQPETLRPAAEQAALRPGWRVDGAGGDALLVLDGAALPEQGARFLAAAEIFRSAGLTVPHILAHDAAQGFMLCTDPGATTYLHQLNHDTANKLYLDALDALVLLQVQSQPEPLPEIDRSALLHELMLFPEWYLGKHLGVTLSEAQQASLNKVFDALLANIAAQPQVWVHRDYQAANLVVRSTGNPGILGFENAGYGPLTYDAVSLLRDAEIQWDEEIVLDWAIRYWERAKRAGLPVARDIDGFYVDFEFMGLQRHLMQLGLFARRYHRDGDDHFLKDIPLLLEYVRKAAFRYKPLIPLVRLMEELDDKKPQVGYTF